MPNQDPLRMLTRRLRHVLEVGIEQIAEPETLIVSRSMHFPGREVVRGGKTQSISVPDGALLTKWHVAIIFHTGVHQDWVIDLAHPFFDELWPESEGNDEHR